MTQVGKWLEDSFLKLCIWEIGQFYIKNKKERKIGYLVGDLRTTPTLRGLMTGLKPFNGGFAKRLNTTIIYFTKN
jgi:hypothetical protein